MKISTFLENCYNYETLTFYLNDKIIDTNELWDIPNTELLGFEVGDSWVVRLYIKEVG